jgi:hypothetical protein
MIRNRLLVHQIESTEKESEVLENQIRKLEDINMDFMTSCIDVDWNMMYGVEDYSDGDDYVFGLDEEDNDAQDGEVEEWSLSDLDQSSPDDSLWESIRPKEQKYISREPVEDIATLARHVMQLELEKRVTNPHMIDVSGEEIQLTRANMVTAGPIKYYESQIQSSF